MASTAAKIAKEKGNVAFKVGNFAEAIGHYSAAVIADREDPTYPLNRAAAYLKLGKHRDAERDCTTVLGLDGKNVKALFRRAQARTALDNLAGAEKDLTEALRLEPTNGAIQQELVVVRGRKADTDYFRREPLRVFPVVSTPSESQTKFVTPQPNRMIRDVPIEIVEAEELPMVAEIESPADFLKPIQSRVLSSPSSSHSSSTLPSSASRPKARVGAAIFRADGRHTVIRDPMTSSSPQPIATPLSSPATTQRHDCSSAPASSSTSPVTLTHFAFSRAWHALLTPEERYALLRRIPPKSLSALFQTSLEPELLVSILRIFADLVTPTTSHEIAEYMNAFPTIPRFATVMLFLSAEEKEIARGVWNALSERNDSNRKLWGV